MSVESAREKIRGELAALAAEREKQEGDEDGMALRERTLPELREDGRPPRPLNWFSARIPPMPDTFEFADEEGMQYSHANGDVYIAQRPRKIRTWGEGRTKITAANGEVRDAVVTLLYVPLATAIRAWVTITFEK